MGQATIDLPDPSELPTAPDASADDLLSQLAGDEIDRLLAEAEVEKAPSPPPEAPPVSVPAAAESTPATPPTELPDAAMVEAPAPTIPAVSTPASTAVDPTADAAMDELFKDLAGAEAALTPVKASAADATAQPPAAAQPPAPADASMGDTEAMLRELDEALARGSADALPAVKAPEPAAPVEPAVAEVETTPLEKNALADAIESIEASAELTSSEEDLVNLPFYLKPLVWLNAPLNALPAEVRDALGKVAILTLANAVAVLAYVMIFRRHH